jgi:hypothetical protein
MILYCNSDSYGVLSTTSNRYSEFLGEKLQCQQVINNGLPGACNQRILRTTLRDLIDLRLKNTQTPILAVICLGSLIRNEWWNLQKPAVGNDGHFETFQIFGATAGANQAYTSYAKEWYRLYDDEAEQTNLFVQLVLLTGWFQHNQIQYIMFAGNSLTYKKMAYDDIFIKEFSNQIFSDPAILNINNFSFVQHCLSKGYHPFDYNLWKENGHHGESAHKDFADFLHDFYIDLYQK